VFGGLKKKDEKDKDKDKGGSFPPPGPIQMPMVNVQREVHSAIIQSTSPTFELNSADIRERRGNRSGTVGGAPPNSDRSNTGSIKAKKGAGGTTRSMLSPRSMAYGEGSEHRVQTTEQPLFSNLNLFPSPSIFHLGFSFLIEETA